MAEQNVDKQAQINTDGEPVNSEPTDNGTDIQAELDKLKSENEQLQQLRDLVFSDEQLFDAVIKKAKGESVTISTGETDVSVKNTQDILPSPPEYFNPAELSDPESASAKWMAQAISVSASTVAKKEVEQFKQNFTKEQQKQMEKMQYEQMFKEIASKEGLSPKEQQEFRQWVEAPKDMPDYIQSAIKAWKVSTNKEQPKQQSEMHPPVNAATVGGAPLAASDANDQFWDAFKNSYERLKGKV